MRCLVAGVPGIILSVSRWHTWTGAPCCLHHRSSRYYSASRKSNRWWSSDSWLVSSWDDFEMRHTDDHCLQCTQLCHHGATTGGVHTKKEGKKEGRKVRAAADGHCAGMMMVVSGTVGEPLQDPCKLHVRTLKNCLRVMPRAALRVTLQLQSRFAIHHVLVQEAYFRQAESGD